MSDYNFWADFLDTFQSSPDWIKAIWLLVPPGFLLALIAMLIRLWIGNREADRDMTGELIYSIRRDSNNLLHIISHVPLANGNPLLMLPPHHDEESESESLPVKRRAI
ncbi:hypothetical protein [Phyllobacterium sp. YR531]|uniref:hypothetical protein n=1 Tax=Phyllobacterium sp. YR531 TaxID=1144343 RepID=UPI00026FAA2F|nr:hypothetical protein [Phyllobacterium sp. YR531]EJN00604.1 hypothetical protein PMI41_03627 [Phyllobacterium sp. YR531]